MDVRRPWRGIRLAMVTLMVAAGAAVPGSAAMADAAGHGGDFVPLGNGVRIVDTSAGVGTTKAPRGPNSTTAVQVLGVGGVPAAGVRAVLVDVAAKQPTAATFLTLWSGDQATRPNVASLQAAAGEQISNGAVVEVGANGTINLYNSAGQTNVLIDVQGYFAALPGFGGGFVPVPSNPTVLSTSGGIGVPVGAVPANGTRTVSLLGAAVPAGSPAVFADLQVSGATTAGYLSTAPAGTTGGASNLEFAPGTTSSGTSIRLSADGRAIIRNNSAGAVSVLIRLQGYFAAGTTQGAGLQPLARRLFDTTMAANSTVDVAVGGTAGLPIKGVAGAAINFSANSPTAAGYLKAWPLGAPEPGSSVATWPAGKQRTGMAVVKPGTDGKIRIRNSSSGTVHLYTDLQGWFADPLPRVPLAGFAPTSFRQTNPGGPIEYSYVDAIGRLRVGHQPDPTDFAAIQWTTTPGLEAFAGQPAMSRLPDGRFQVTAQNTDSNIWSFTQTTAGGAAWGAGTGLGGSMASAPSQVTLGDHTTVVFAVDSDGALWHYRPVAATSYWRNLGDQDLTGPVTAVPVAQGAHLFALDRTGAVRTALYAADGSIPDWTSLGGGGITDRPAAVAYPDGRLRVFVRAADGSVRTRLRAADGTWSADWTAVGTFSAAGAPAVILDPVLVRTAVVARGTDGEIYQVYETGPGTGAWGGWTPVHPGVTDPAATDPSVGEVYSNSAGQTWAIAYRDADNINRVYERNSPGPASR